MNPGNQEVPPQPLRPDFEVSEGSSLSHADIVFHGPNRGGRGRAFRGGSLNHHGYTNRGRGCDFGQKTRVSGHAKVSSSLGSDVPPNNPNRGNGGRGQSRGGFNHIERDFGHAGTGSNNGGAYPVQPGFSGGDRSGNEGPSGLRGRFSYSNPRQFKERFGGHNQRKLADKKRNL